MAHAPTLICLLAGTALLAGCSTSPTPVTPLSEVATANTPAPATPAALAALNEADLRLARLVAGGQTVALPAEKLPVLQFLEGGRVAGFAGVNRFNGAFTLRDGGVLEWSPGPAVTRMAGPPERMALESAFLKALPATTRLGVLPYGVVFQSDDGKNVVELVK
ncbi:MAG: META domain-containing protein [Limisphaerales bacterium]